jgi:hypothetical protein
LKVFSDSANFCGLKGFKEEMKACGLLPGDMYKMFQLMKDLKASEFGWRNQDLLEK